MTPRETHLYGRLAPSAEPDRPSRALSAGPHLGTERGFPLSVQEVARQTGLSIPTVRRKIASGELTAYKLGSRVIVFERDLNAMLDNARIKSIVERPSSRPPVGIRCETARQGLRRLLVAERSQTNVEPDPRSASSASATDMPPRVG